MATYRQVQELIRSRYGVQVQTCWIADVKEGLGMTMRKAPNRKSETRVKPCPADKKSLIEKALIELDRRTS